MTKICEKCRKEKPIEEFSKTKQGKYKNRCKRCEDNLRTKAYKTEILITKAQSDIFWKYFQGANYLYNICVAKLTKEHNKYIDKYTDKKFQEKYNFLFEKKDNKKEVAQVFPAEMRIIEAWNKRAEEYSQSESILTSPKNGVEEEKRNKPSKGSKETIEKINKLVKEFGEEHIITKINLYFDDCNNGKRQKKSHYKDLRGFLREIIDSKSPEYVKQIRVFTDYNTINKDVTRIREGKYSELEILKDLSKDLLEDPLEKLESIKYLSKTILDNSVKAFSNAVTKYKTFPYQFSLDKEGKNYKLGFPKFKSNRNSQQSIGIRKQMQKNAKTSPVKIANRKVWINEEIGWVKIREKKQYLPLDAIPVGFTISKNSCNKWFISYNCIVEKECFGTNLEGKVLGIDVGCRKNITVYDGESHRILPDTDEWKKIQNRIDEIDRKIAFLESKAPPTKKNPLKEGEPKRKEKGSKNHKKLRLKINKLRYNKTCLLDHVQHNMTTSIVNPKNGDRPRLIGIESLNVKGLMSIKQTKKRNKKKEREETNTQIAYRNKQLQNARLGTLLQQIKYKSDWYDVEVVEVRPDFPSSKKCSDSDCGEINEIGSEEKWTCVKCKKTHDRDINASINIRNEALRSLKK